MHHAIACQILILGMAQDGPVEHTAIFKSATHDVRAGDGAVVIGERDEMNALTLPNVRMPNRNGFVWIDAKP